MNSWLRITLVAIILLLVGGIGAGVFVFHQDLTNYPFMDEDPFQNSPGSVLVVLLSPLLLAIIVLWSRHFADNVSVFLIQYFGGWYSAGYFNTRSIKRLLMSPST
jgi:hypothetical protein